MAFPAYKISMPEHGDYNQKGQWFCHEWIDKKQWLEIHGYPPISINIESDEYGTIQNS